MQHVFCRRITDPSSPWSDLRQLAAFWQKSGCTISVCTYPNQPRPALFNVLTSSTYYLPIQSWQETPMEQCYIPPEWGLHVVNFCLEAKYVVLLDLSETSSSELETSPWTPSSAARLWRMAFRWQPSTQWLCGTHDPNNQEQAKCEHIFFREHQ